jgi:RimJ/RimL family protein N-acetyltransferase
MEERAGVEVRPAMEADVDEILDVFEAVVAEGRWMGTEAPVDRAEKGERLRAAVGDLRQAVLVAVEAGRIVGHLSLEVAGYGVASLGMEVARDSRGRGVGTALMEEAVATARRLGAHKVSLQLWPGNAAALALYRKFGFVEEGRLRRQYRRRNGELWDALIMGLVLDETTPGGPGAGGRA